ncbi:hypothetical protein J2O02_18270 (plasmid) [Elizabethkingia anophelis]|uniref:hypothetical protein n=1 Tax=Elizabethkingia anophelis TaxID=1117645 RepID=UPI0020B73E9A|nr:hypothetical protein [Elizabethkingia anophelis]UTG66812.1 hypothetical protein J2O02_18270 [Elizabethkingia anophelis]
MLNVLRKKIVKNPEELDKFLGKDWEKWYVEKNYEKDKVFKYILFLRMKGANINKFLDQVIKSKENE